MTSPDSTAQVPGTHDTRSELQTAGILPREGAAIADDAREAAVALGETLLRRVQRDEKHADSLLDAARDAFARAGDVDRLVVTAQLALCTYGLTDVARTTLMAARKLGAVEQPEIVSEIAEKLARTGMIKELQEFCGAMDVAIPVETVRAALADPNRRSWYGDEELRARFLTEGPESILADIPDILADDQSAYDRLYDVRKRYALLSAPIPQDVFDALFARVLAEGNAEPVYELETLVDETRKAGMAAPRAALERITADKLRSGEFEEARALLMQFDPEGAERRIVARAKELMEEFAVKEGPGSYLGSQRSGDDYMLSQLLACVRILQGAGETVSSADVVACVMASIPPFIRDGRMHNARDHSDYVCRHADADTDTYMRNALEILTLLGARDALIALGDALAGPYRDSDVVELVITAYERAGAIDRLSIAADCTLRRGNIEEAMALYERAGKNPTSDALYDCAAGISVMYLAIQSGDAVDMYTGCPFSDEERSMRIARIERDLLLVTRMAEKPEIRSTVPLPDAAYEWPVVDRGEAGDHTNESDDGDEDDDR